MIGCYIHHDIGSLHVSAGIAEPSVLATVRGDCGECIVVSGGEFVAS